MSSLRRRGSQSVLDGPAAEREDSEENDTAPEEPARYLLHFKGRLLSKVVYDQRMRS